MKEIAEKVEQVKNEQEKMKEEKVSSLAGSHLCDALLQLQAVSESHPHWSHSLIVIRSHLTDYETEVRGMYTNPSN